MAATSTTNDLEYLELYLSACSERLARCVDVVAHKEVVNGVSTTTRMHYLRFDGNGIPMIAALAECLYQHVVDYCIAARNRQGTLTRQDEARLLKEARKYFIHPVPTPSDPDQTGEAGECLLYLLIESILRAPQVVAKMELKTNPNDEVKGSDGIHMSWHDADGVLDVYFGEAKLRQDISGALDSAFKSITDFHADDMCRHEFKMATKHFKYADEHVKAAVENLLRDGVPAPEVRVNHVCLIGYDWTKYDADPAVAGPLIADDFRNRYAADARRLHDLIQSRFNKFTLKHLRFEVFFLPFPSVQQLRTAFNAALD